MSAVAPEVWGIGDSTPADDYAARILSIPDLQAYYRFDTPHNVIQFPSAVVDTFDRADQDPVSAAIWQPRAHVSAVGTPRPMKIQGNSILASAASGNQSYGVYLPGGVMTDSEAYVTVTGSGYVYPNPARYSGVVLRYQPGVAGDVARGYAVGMAVGDTNASGHSTGLQILRLGSPTVQLGGGTSSPPNIFPGDKIGAQMDGDALSVYQWTAASGLWRLVGRWNDSTYSSGYCGVYADPNVTLDDFACGPLQLDPSIAWPFPPTGGTAWSKNDFIRDYSTFKRNLSAVQDASVSYGANPPTFLKKPGCVSPDDGSVQFNIGYYIWTGPFSANRIGLVAPFSPGEYVSNVINQGVTISFFVKFIPSVRPPDGWAPYDPGQAPDIPFVTTRYRGFSAVPAEGWCFWLGPYSGVMTYTTTTNQGFPSGAWTVGTLVPNAWSHVVVRVAPVSLVAPKTWRRTIYLNETVVFDQTADYNTIAPIPGGGTSLSFGGGMGDDLRWNVIRGGIDEFALWSRPLSDPELALIGDRSVRSWGGTA